MIKTRVQAQYLQIGDIVGSGEVVIALTVRSLRMPSNKVAVTLKQAGKQRTVQWGKYTEIGVERSNSVTDSNGIEHHV
jgi:hypothetical protein